jgi:hypothetical protein
LSQVCSVFFKAPLQPGFAELADEIGLNLKKLKWFQTNLWGYRLWILFDYGFCSKIDSGSYNVNEVGLKIDTARKPLYSGIQKKFYNAKKKYLTINPMA